MPSRSSLRLRIGTVATQREPGVVQIGTDPRWMISMEGLTDDEVGWLRHAAINRHTSLASMARRFGIPAERRDEILTVLAESGALVTARSENASENLPVTAPSSGAADVVALSALRIDGLGRLALARRAQACVAVVGLGRIGASVAVQLAIAGVGGVVPVDPTPVQITDIGFGLYTRDAVGTLRGPAMTGALERLVQELRFTTKGPPDVVVMTESHAARPAAYTGMMSAGTAHLPVVMREADVIVGPLVVPGTSACVRCVDLHVTDDDPSWPVVAEQHSQEPPAQVETVLASMAAAVATAQVLAHIDGGRASAHNALIEISLPAAMPRVTPVTPHPGCGCTVLGPA